MPPDGNSPLHNFPTEILQEIFTVCVNTSHLPYPVIGPTKKLSARDLRQLVISRVCSSWRQVALSTPELWNTVSIHCSGQSDLDVAKTWLSCAAGAPVSITLYFTDIKVNDWVNGYQFDVKEFLSAFRLRHLNLTSHPFPTLLSHELISSLTQSSVATLESLKINHHDLPTSATWKMDDDRYPSLYSLSLQGNWIIKPPSNILRSLFCGSQDLSAQQCWNILRDLPFLEECTLGLNLDSSPPGSEATPVDHPLLRRLQMNLRVPHGSGIEGTFAIFIRPLILPHLEVFTVFGHPIEWPVTAFQMMAKQSNNFPYLDSFSLSGTKQECDIGTFLSSIPTVTKLTLGHNVMFGKNTLKGLATGRLGPKLHTLNLFQNTNIEEFVEMIELRMENAHLGQLVPFKRVTFYALEKPPASVESRLQSLPSQGSHVFVYTRSI